MIDDCALVRPWETPGPGGSYITTTFKKKLKAESRKGPREKANPSRRGSDDKHVVRSAQRRGRNILRPYRNRIGEESGEKPAAVAEAVGGRKVGAGNAMETGGRCGSRGRGVSGTDSASLRQRKGYHGAKIGGVAARIGAGPICCLTQMCANICAPVSERSGTSLLTTSRVAQIRASSNGLKPRPNTSALPLPAQPNPLLKYFTEHNDGRAGDLEINHYFDSYDRHFARFRGQEVNVLEIGIYSGGSLFEMWQSYFGPHCQSIWRGYRTALQSL